MSNQTITGTSITVHGRGSLVLPFAMKDAVGAPIDISEKVIYFEVDGIPIREQLEADPNNALGQRLVLERTQIATLKKTPSKFSIVDETLSVDDLFVVLWTGTIARDGYVGAPDATED